MKAISLAAAVALTLTVLSVQARDTVPVEAVSRGGGPGQPAVVLNTAIKRSLDVALVMGRAGVPVKAGTPAAAPQYASRHVSAVMGRS